MDSEPPGKTREVHVSIEIDLWISACFTSSSLTLSVWNSKDPRCYSNLLVLLSLFYLFVFVIGVYLLYSVVLVSVVQQSESTIYLPS